MGRENSGYFRTEKMSPKQRQEAVALVNNGAPKAKVAAMYDVSRTYIYALLNPKKKKTKKIN